MEIRIEKKSFYKSIWNFIWKYRIINFIILGYLSLDAKVKSSTIEDLKIKVIKLEAIKSTATSNIIALYSVLDDIEIAIAIARKEGDFFKTIFINKTYENEWLKPQGLNRHDVMFKTVFSFFPKKKAILYNNRDLIVALTGEKTEFTNIEKDSLGGYFTNKVIKSRLIDRDTFLVKQIYQKKN